MSAVVGAPWDEADGDVADDLSELTVDESQRAIFLSKVDAGESFWEGEEVVFWGFLSGSRMSMMREVRGEVGWGRSNGHLRFRRRGWPFIYRLAFSSCSVHLAPRVSPAIEDRQQAR